MKHKLSRRNILALAGAGVAMLSLSSCAKDEVECPDVPETTSIVQQGTAPSQERKYYPFDANLEKSFKEEYEESFNKYVSTHLGNFEGYINSVFDSDSEEIYITVKCNSPKEVERVQKFFDEFVSSYSVTNLSIDPYTFENLEYDFTRLKTLNLENENGYYPHRINLGKIESLENVRTVNTGIEFFGAYINNLVMIMNCDDQPETIKFNYDYSMADRVNIEIYNAKNIDIHVPGNEVTYVKLHNCNGNNEIFTNASGNVVVVYNDTLNSESRVSLSGTYGIIDYSDKLNNESYDISNIDSINGALYYNGNEVNRGLSRVR